MMLVASDGQRTVAWQRASLEIGKLFLMAPANEKQHSCPECRAGRQTD
jgi:hypothetical protein